MTSHFGWNYLRYDPEEAKSELDRELLGASGATGGSTGVSCSG